MSIATELTRIQGARNTIRNTMVGWGVAQSTDAIDDLAEKLEDVVDRGTPSATVAEGESYTIQAGYYHGGTVTGTGGGSQYTLQAKSGITPTTASQTITADAGYYGLSSVQINPIPSNYKDVSSVDATAADVLANKIIVTADGAVTTGTMANNGAVSATIDGLTVSSYTIPAGYHNGSGTVSLDNSIATALAAI